MSSMSNISSIRRDIADRLGFAAMGPAPLKGSPARKAEIAQNKESAAERKKALLTKKNVAVLKRIEADYNNALSGMRELAALMAKKMAEVKSRTVNGDVDAEEYRSIFDEAESGIGQTIEVLKDYNFARPGAKVKFGQFNEGDKVTAKSSNQGMKAGSTYTVTDVEEQHTPFGTFVTYVLDNKLRIANGHMLLTKSISSRPGAKAKMGMEEDYYSRGVRAAQMSGLVPDFQTGVQDSPWFQLGYKMGEKYGLKASGMIKSAPSEFPKIAARITPAYRMSRPGAKVKFDSQSDYTALRRYYKMAIEGNPDVFEDGAAERIAKKAMSSPNYRPNPNVPWTHDLAAELLDELKGA
jgi:hypothetical protein